MHAMVKGRINVEFWYAITREDVRNMTRVLKCWYLRAELSNYSLNSTNE